MRCVYANQALDIAGHAAKMMYKLSWF